MKSPSINRKNRAVSAATAAGDRSGCRATMRDLALDAQPSSSESGDACLAQVTVDRIAARRRRTTMTVQACGLHRPSSRARAVGDASWKTREAHRKHYSDRSIFSLQLSPDTGAASLEWGCAFCDFSKFERAEEA